MFGRSREERAKRTATRYTQGQTLALIREDTREMKALLVAILIGSPLATKYLGSAPFVFLGELVLLTGLIYATVRFVQMWPERSLLRSERDVLRLIVVPILVALGAILALDLGVLSSDVGLVILTTARVLIAGGVALYAHRLAGDIALRELPET